MGYFTLFLQKWQVFLFDYLKLAGFGCYFLTFMCEETSGQRSRSLNAKKKLPAKNQFFDSQQSALYTDSTFPILYLAFIRARSFHRVRLPLKPPASPPERWQPSASEFCSSCYCRTLRSRYHQSYR